MANKKKKVNEQGFWAGRAAHSATLPHMPPRSRSGSTLMPQQVQQLVIILVWLCSTWFLPLQSQ